MTWIFTAIGIIGIIMGSDFNQEALLFEKQETGWRTTTGRISGDTTEIYYNNRDKAEVSKTNRDVALVIGAASLSYAISEMLPKSAPVKVGDVQGNELIRFAVK